MTNDQRLENVLDLAIKTGKLYVSSDIAGADGWEKVADVLKQIDIKITLCEFLSPGTIVAIDPTALHFPQEMTPSPFSPN